MPVNKYGIALWDDEPLFDYEIIPVEVIEIEELNRLSNEKIELLRQELSWQ